MQDYEKLGVFYLGREIEAETGAARDELLLYDSKDLTTHAVCVGMTGSGKTGLCLALLEEAALDGIPAICIDPKGDLGNLLLTFPQLAPADFAPWVDGADAARKGVSPEQLAQDTAAVWKKGLGDWGQGLERIARLREAADLAIYTPGSNTGLPLSVLRSFAAPAPELLEDAPAMRDRIATLVCGLLALLGRDADPLQSREHILLANLLEHAWRAGQTLDMPGLIAAVQKPPFDKVGAFDLDTFYPPKERLALAMAINNLLASPGFAAWLEGEPLDAQRLLFTPEGKPRIAIVSIAHLADAERMFIVTLLLNEVIAWMRAQSGTSSLRAILYMDEIFGYFPPTANPPSKAPMLTLLKQARAYGLGCVLATQNPVDLDYKGLSNAGTWFIGRLQTERDKMRVLEGLESALAGAGGYDRPTLDRMMSGLKQRVFLMRNAHDDAPVLFQSRWALSYLRGPMTGPEISRLMAPRKAGARGPAAHASAGGASAGGASAVGASARGVPAGSVLAGGAPAGGTPAGGPAGSTNVVQGNFGAARSSAPSVQVSVEPNADATARATLEAADTAAERAGADATAAGISPAATPPPRNNTIRPSVPPDVPEYCLTPLAGAAEITYRPMVMGVAKLHFIDSKLALDQWRTNMYLAPLSDDGGNALWDEAQVSSDLKSRLGKGAVANAAFSGLPAPAMRAASYAQWGKALAAHLYQNARAEVFVCDAFKISSVPDESEGDFRARLTLAARERRDAAVEDLRRKYAPKLLALQERERRAQERVKREKSQLSQQKLQTAFTIGASVFGALLGQRRVSVSNVNRAASAARSAGRIGRESGDVDRADDNLEAVQQQGADLQRQLEAETAALGSSLEAGTVTLRKVQVSPRKSDVAVGEVALVWVPWKKGVDGFPEPAYE
jgi:hypothetical protein